MSSSAPVTYYILLTPRDVDPYEAHELRLFDITAQTRQRRDVAATVEARLLDAGVIDSYGLREHWDVHRVERAVGRPGQRLRLILDYFVKARAVRIGETAKEQGHVRVPGRKTLTVLVWAQDTEKTFIAHLPVRRETRSRLNHWHVSLDLDYDIVSQHPRWVLHEAAIRVCDRLEPTLAATLASDALQGADDLAMAFEQHTEEILDEIPFVVDDVTV